MKTQADFDFLHHGWCQETIQRYGPATAEPERMFLRYRQVQKWLTMALKYCAVLGYPAPTAWSTLTKAQHRDYQHDLRAALAAHHTGTLTLDWEADVWASPHRGAVKPPCLRPRP